MGLVEDAEQFATQAHEGHIRKGGEPHIEHLRRVAASVAGEGASEEAVAAAWLHDVLEDTAVYMTELMDHFPLAVCFMVHCLTDHFPSGAKMGRHHRKALECLRLSHCPKEVQTIKAYDRADNLNGMASLPYTPFHDLYISESCALQTALSGASSKSHLKLRLVLSACKLSQTRGNNVT